MPTMWRNYKSENMWVFKMWIGKKIEKGKLIEFDSKPKETKDDKFEYFDPSDNGMATWTELIIYVIPKQKIKYEP